MNSLHTLFNNTVLLCSIKAHGLTLQMLLIKGLCSLGVISGTAPDQR